MDATDLPVSPAPSPGTVPVSGLGLVLVLLVGAIVGVALTGAPGDGADGGADVEPPSIPESTPVGDTDVGVATGTAGTDAGASVVPGLSDDGVSDLSALATAHARNLLGRSYTLWMDTYRPPPDDRDGPPVQFDTDVAVAGRVFLVEENVGDDEDRRRLRTVYYDGEEWFVASETAEGTTYERLTLADSTPPPAPNPDRVARELVTDYLSTPVTSIEGPVNGTGEDEGPTHYRVVGRGVPSPMDGDGVENYTAVALVDRDGLVRDLAVAYTVVAGTERYRVRKEWTYGNLGETAVRPPVWYGERFTPNVTAPPRTAD